MKTFKIAALPLALALTFAPVVAHAYPNTESTLPQDGVQTISRDGGTWTITFDGTPWESKVISNPQKILCGTNYGKPCHSTETFTWAKPCVYIQTDWQGSHNSSDIYVCRDEPSTSPTPTPSASPSPSETATPEPEFEYWDKTTVTCKGAGDEWMWTDHYRRVKGTSKWTWISKYKTPATAKQCPEPTATPSPSTEPTPTETPTPTPSIEPSATPSPTQSSSASASTPITSPSPSEEHPNEPSPTAEPSSSTPVVPSPPHTSGGTAATHPAEAAPDVTTGSTTHTSVRAGTDQPGTQTSVREVHLAHTGLASTGLGISGLLIAVGIGLLIVRRKAAK